MDFDFPDILYTKYYKNKSVALNKHLYFIAELVHITARNSWNTKSYPDRGRGNTRPAKGVYKTYVLSGNHKPKYAVLFRL